MRNALERQQSRAAWFFVGPALTLIAVFFFVPVLGGLLLSLTDFDLYAVGAPGTFIAVLKAAARPAAFQIIPVLSKMSLDRRGALQTIGRGSRSPRIQTSGGSHGSDVPGPPGLRVPGDGCHSSEMRASSSGDSSKSA